MPIALTRFKERITIDRAFAESVANELRSSQFTNGTILLVANEILLDPSYIFNYNSTDVNFPGRYDLILVADHFDSRGGRIDLTGSPGITPRTPRPRAKGMKSSAQEDPDGGPPMVFIDDGMDGTLGDNGTPGGPSNKIKFICNRLVNTEMFANGGPGGNGGSGGDGGEGGDGAKEIINHRPFFVDPGSGGDGGKGGIGSDGGSGGMIVLNYCEAPSGFVVSDHIHSIGGKGGDPGGGGDGGLGGKVFGPSNERGPSGRRGPSGDSGGNRGQDLIPDVKQLEFKELWEKVIIELKIPSG